MMRVALFFFHILFLGGQLLVYGQDVPNNRDNYRVHIYKAESELKIDGILDEKIWSQAEIADSFYRILPIDTGFAEAQTEVKLYYDESNIYMGIVCHDTLPGKRPVESLRRDFSFGRNDNFIAFIDTYNDRTNGFAFGISAAGAQWEGMQANGGFVSLDWDCKWRSAVTNHPDYWIAEFSIPFRSIRYRGEDMSWGINFSRMDLKSNEKSSWAPVPRQFQSADLAYTGTLVWDHPLPDPGVRFSIIPYLSGKVLQDNEAGESIRFKGGAGLDAKIILSTSMNLDITINPDYS
ncbi:MAG: carbohydrate binding family 9 domain-containing protein, partial [Bacteroidales bacterium]|nr:carbohydrate binding family 9 domain-containing protein [Bacteroidales bacterium]